MRTWRMILFLVVMTLNHDFINFQIKTFPGMMVYPVYYYKSYLKNYVGPYEYYFNYLNHKVIPNEWRIIDVINIYKGQEANTMWVCTNQLD